MSFIDKATARKLVDSCSDSSFTAGYFAGSIQWVLTFVLIIHHFVKIGMLQWVKQ